MYDGLHAYWSCLSIQVQVQSCRAQGGLEAERNARDKVQADKEAQDKRNHDQLLAQRRESFRKVADVLQPLPVMKLPPLLVILNLSQAAAMCMMMLCLTSLFQATVGVFDGTRQAAITLKSMSNPMLVHTC